MQLKEFNYTQECACSSLNFSNTLYFVHKTVNSPTEVFTAPNIHLSIVFAEFLKVRFVDDKQSASNHRGSNGLCRILLSRLSFRLAEIFPFED